MDLQTFEQQAAAGRSAKERRKLASMYRELQTVRRRSFSFVWLVG